MNREIIKDTYLSFSQYGQDIFVLSELNFKKNGYFVEFGTGNGKNLSNTHLLEKNYNWSGFLAEPAKSWHEELLANRNCQISFDLVHPVTGLSLEFKEYFSESHLGQFKKKILDKKLFNKNIKYKYITLELSI